MRRLRDLARRLWGEEPQLAATGAAGVLLGAACAAAIFVRGPLIPPEGDLTKAASFDAAIGIYVLTLAALTPFSGFGPRGRRVWRVATIAAILYFYFAETLPTLRGLDPRFSAAATGFDRWVAALFGFDALVVTALSLAFFASFFARSASPARPGLVAGVRWAGVAAALALGVGFWMIGVQGRTVGAEGSALLAHALGFHAVQAVPLVGWLSDRGRLGRGWVHAAGGLWVAATLAAVAQAAAGRPPLAPDLAVILTGVSLLAWAVVLAAALRRAARYGPG